MFRREDEVGGPHSLKVVASLPGHHSPSAIRSDFVHSRSTQTSAASRRTPVTGQPLLIPLSRRGPDGAERLSSPMPRG